MGFVIHGLTLFPRITQRTHIFSRTGEGGLTQYLTHESCHALRLFLTSRVNNISHLCIRQSKGRYKSTDKLGVIITYRTNIHGKRIQSYIPFALCGLTSCMLPPHLNNTGIGNATEGSLPQLPSSPLQLPRKGESPIC